MSIMKKMKYQWFLVPFSILVIGYLGTITYALYSKQYSFSEYFINYGDSFGALLTSISILLIIVQMRVSDEDKRVTLQELEKDRKLTLELHRKEVLKKRLKEQLEYYSPLVGRCLRFDFEETEPRSWLREVTNQLNINSQYQLYSEPATKEAFRQYFSGELRGTENWKEVREDIKKFIIRDFQSLAYDYEDLVKSYQPKE